MTTPWTPGKLPPTRSRSNAIDQGDGGFKAAVGAIEAARREALQRVLGGTHLTAAPSRVAKLTKSIRGNAKDIKSAAAKSQAVAGKGQAAIGMLSKFRPGIQADIMKLFGDAVLGEVISFIGQDVVDAVTNVLAEATPILGIAKSGVSVVHGIFKIATDTVALLDAGSSKGAFSPGDAQAAVTALEGLIEREIAFNSVALARDTLALSAKAASAAGDFGTAGTMAVGIANGVVALIENLAAAAIDFREMRAGNRLLAGTLSTQLFVACPLTACYFITCASTSDILNLAPSKIGSATFQAETEALRKRILNAQKRAAKAIESSRYLLEKDGVEVKPHMKASGGLTSFDHSTIQFKRKLHHFAQSVKASLPGMG
jgi:hypothetical protein